MRGAQCLQDRQSAADRHDDVGHDEIRRRRSVSVAVLRCDRHEESAAIRDSDDFRADLA